MFEKPSAVPSGALAPRIAMRNGRREIANKYENIYEEIWLAWRYKGGNRRLTALIARRETLPDNALLASSRNVIVCLRRVRTVELRNRNGAADRGNDLSSWRCTETSGVLRLPRVCAMAGAAWRASKMSRLAIHRRSCLKRASSAVWPACPRRGVAHGA